MINQTILLCSLLQLSPPLYDAVAPRWKLVRASPQATTPHEWAWQEAIISRLDSLTFVEDADIISNSQEDLL